MEVTADARKICQAERRERVGERIRAALREAVSSGLSAEEIRRLVEDEIGRLNGKRRE
jgi:DNA-binding transcriptional regulator YhcF (GntR family)